MLPCRKTRLNAVQAVATQYNRLQIVRCCNTIQLVAELCSVATQYAIGRLSRLHRIAAEQVALAHCSAYLLLQEDAMAALVALLFCHEPDLCFKENKLVIELGHQYAAKPSQRHCCCTDSVSTVALHFDPVRQLSLYKPCWAKAVDCQ